MPCGVHDTPGLFPHPDQPFARGWSGRPKKPASDRVPGGYPAIPHVFSRCLAELVWKEKVGMLSYAPVNLTKETFT